MCSTLFHPFSAAFLFIKISEQAFPETPFCFGDGGESRRFFQFELPAAVHLPLNDRPAIAAQMMHLLIKMEKMAGLRFR